MNSLKTIVSIKEGDIIVVPKMDKIKKEITDSFTIFEVIGPFEFDPIDIKEWGTADFGSKIKVDCIVSYNYNLNNNTKIVSSRFGAYRYPINHIWNENIINAINDLIENKENQNENNGVLSKVMEAEDIIKNEQEYIKSIISTIDSYTPQDFEKLIVELFVKMGYDKIYNNKYDREGADIDIAFNMIESEGLIGDIVNYGIEYNYELPELRIQVKKKAVADVDHTNAIEQLIKMTEYDNNKAVVNVVISLVNEFNDETKKLAKKKNVILINGKQFVKLLIKYAKDIFV